MRAGAGPEEWAAAYNGASWAPTDAENAGTVSRVTPDRERDVERIVHLALERSAEQRAGFLDEACRGDAGLRQAVEELLAYESAASAFLASPAANVATAARRSSAPALHAGQRLGTYTIVSSLGAGGMGQVYRARDEALGREVAVKVLPPEFTQDHDRLARFEREARVLAALNHPNVATIHGVERVPSTGPNETATEAIVLELVEGDTLEERLSHGGRLALAEALGIAQQVAEALEAAHAKGIVHRDLKPANIKIRPDGVVKVLDFGLAKAVRTETAALDVSHSPTVTIGATAEGVAIGTAAYMSPEQAAGRPVDGRTDVWAFGVVLYEMVTGRLPFRGDSAPELLAAIFSEAPALDGVPPPARPVIEKCLRKDPRRRWQSIGDVRLALEEGLAVHDLPPRAGDRRLVMALAVVAAILLAAVALLVSGQFRASQPERLAARFTVPIPGGDASNVNFAVSPDGKNLAITALTDGKRHLYVRAADSLTAKLIPDTEGANYPFWSPDGTRIGFAVDRKLRTVGTSGDAAFTLVDDVGGTFYGASWHSNGTILFAGQGLRSVDQSGGSPVDLLVRDRGNPSHPQFLPDGRAFLFTQADPRDASVNQGIFVGFIDGSPPRRLLDDRSKAEYVPPPAGDGPGLVIFRHNGTLMARPFDAGNLTFAGSAVQVTPETVISINGYGPSVLFSTSPGGTLTYQPLALEQLVWVDRTGAVVERVGPPGEYRNFRLSPDGNSVAMDINIFGNGPSSADVAKIDLRRGILERLTVHGEADLVPVWSPDGSRIAFTSLRQGAFNPHLTTGPDSAELLADMGVRGGWPVDWSPDGRFVLWEGNGLWAIPVSRAEKPSQILTSNFRPRHAQFSPDGRWVAYSSIESGREEIYVQSVPPGRRLVVTGTGGSGPAWRRDGRELFYVAGDGRLTAVPTTIGATSIEFGPPQSLFPARVGNFKREYEASPDGERFLIATPVLPGGAAITVVLNWQTLLER
jgi:Tol biopolymer transport system component/tRNA A-37 threonylcarbamoyl transferase component Bud32